MTEFPSFDQSPINPDFQAEAEKLDILKDEVLSLIEKLNEKGDQDSFSEFYSEREEKIGELKAKYPSDVYATYQAWFFLAGGTPSKAFDKFDFEGEDSIVSWLENWKIKLESRLNQSTT